MENMIQSPQEMVADTPAKMIAVTGAVQFEPVPGADTLETEPTMEHALDAELAETQAQDADDVEVPDEQDEEDEGDEEDEDEGEEKTNKKKPTDTRQA